MKKLILICQLVIISHSGWADETELWLQKLSTLPLDKREASIDSFMQVQSNFPLIENNTTVCFFYRGEAIKVSLAGDFNNWKPVNHLHKIDKTTLWYLQMNFLPDARLEYKYVIDGRDWITDPLNTIQEFGGFGANSAFSMPGYALSSTVVKYDTVVQGTMRQFSLGSRFLRNTREITCYLPAGYDSSRIYPMILFHDGLDYIKLARATIILDNLIRAQKIQPLIAVFVPPVDRTAEYAERKQKNFIKFIIAELMPEVEKRYAIAPDPNLRAVIGASYGGNISLVLGTRYPETFGKVAAQSGFVQPSLLAYASKGKQVPLSLYLDMGIYDIPLLIPLMSDFAALVSPKCHQLWYRENSQGHNWASWRDHLPEILVYFFARR